MSNNERKGVYETGAFLLSLIYSLVRKATRMHPITLEWYELQEILYALGKRLDMVNNTITYKTIEDLFQKLYPFYGEGSSVVPRPTYTLSLVPAEEESSPIEGGSAMVDG